MSNSGFLHESLPLGGDRIKKIVFWILIVVSSFGYELGKDESLILNTDGKYYRRNEDRPFSGVGLFDSGFSYYFGGFKDGMKEGFGEYICLGEKYIGEFKGGLFHGKGILKKKNGEILEGIWERHEFVRQLK